MASVIGLAGAFLVVSLLSMWMWRLGRLDQRRAHLECAVLQCFPGPGWRGRIGLSVRPYIVLTGAQVRLSVIAWTECEVMEALVALMHRLPRSVQVTLEGTVGLKTPQGVRLTVRGMKTKDGCGWRRPDPRRAVVMALLLAFGLGSCGVRGDGPSSWQGHRQRHTVLTLDDLAEWGVETAEIVFEGKSGTGAPLKIRLLVAGNLVGPLGNVSGLLEVRSASQSAVYRLNGQAHRVRGSGGEHATLFQLSAERLRGAVVPVSIWIDVSIDEGTGRADMSIHRTPRFVHGQTARDYALSGWAGG
ncbi:MAG: hypothetical protein L0Z62_22080 [Gemmataceae bacterium]|nr:hypothetical protein [Gemmataceae bacterium]